MLSISDQSFAAFSGSMRQNYIERLARDLYETYPERFRQATQALMTDYVGGRVAYAEQHEMLRESCVAMLAHIECRTLSDFVRDHDNGWWRDTLEDDAPEENKIARLLDMTEGIEIHPDFVSVFD